VGRDQEAPQRHSVVGAAKAGNWRNQLSQASILQIETAWGELMTSLGYPLTSPAIELVAARRF